ncbi:MAG: DUF3786 domain-containing protein [Candidatus Thermoplasmatota archaeon]|nr:DUF3786 domain-containing protein [Candidatus Thermoplasmatota archaeon]
MKEDAQYLHALEVSWEKLLSLDPSITAENANVNFDKAREEFTVPWLNEIFYVKLETKEVVASNGQSANTLLSLVILRYLLGSKNIELSNRLVSFRDLHGGDIYYGVFERSVIKPIVKNFVSQPEKLIEVASLFGGRKLDYGDASVEIKVFPRLPITIILWKGDEEVPGSANVVFDESAKYQLSAEEICVISTLVVSKLLRALS